MNFAKSISLKNYECEKVAILSFSCKSSVTNKNFKGIKDDNFDRNFGCTCFAPLLDDSNLQSIGSKQKFGTRGLERD